MVLSDLNPQSRVMEHHNKLPEGTERLFRFQASHVNVGTDLADFIYKGQLVQAEALKTAVEHWRRRKFSTAGSLFWQLNDCWPVTSWSVIDSALRPKAAYYYAKKFFAPVLVSFRNAGRALEVWGTSDVLAPLKRDTGGHSRSFDGAVAWSKTAVAVVGRNASKLLMRIDAADYAHIDPAQSYLLALPETRGRRAFRKQILFCRTEAYATSIAECRFPIVDYCRECSYRDDCICNAEQKYQD